MKGRWPACTVRLPSSCSISTRRARLHRGLCAVPGQCREPVRYRPVAEVRGRPVPHRRADAEPLYLIPTAEVPVTNIVRDEILAAEGAAAEVRLPYAVLPLGGGLVAADTRGMIRQHQFDKVELVQVVTPENRSRHTRN